MLSASAILLCSHHQQTPIAVTCQPLEGTSVGFVSLTIQVAGQEPFVDQLFVAQKGRALFVDYWKLYNALQRAGHVQQGCTLIGSSNLILCSGKDRISESASLVALEDEVEIDLE